MNTYAIYDIETPLITSLGSYHVYDIFCISVATYIDGVLSKPLVFTNDTTLESDGKLIDALNLINSCTYRAGHNITRFDDIVLEQLGGTFTNKVFDTLLYTQIMYTKDDLMSMDYGIHGFPKELYGSFSLKAFGYRLGGNLKIEFEQFDHITQDMLTYCKGDVDVTSRLLLHIIQSDRLPSNKLMQLEHDCSKIISYLERDGFYMDKTKARELSLKLNMEMMSIKTAMSKVFKPLYLPDGPVQKTNRVIKRKMYRPNENYIDKWTDWKPYGKPHKKYKSGKLKPFAKNAFKWFSVPHITYVQEKYGEYQNIKLTKFSATDKQIIKWLEHLYNYKFTTYTAKGNIRVDRDVLDSFGNELTAIANGDTSNTELYNSLARFNSLKPDEKLTEAEAVSQLRRYMKIKKDLSQLSGTEGSLLANQRIDGTITTRLNQNGTVTSRVTSCLPLDYLVSTPSGAKRYSELKVGDVVYGYDIENKVKTLSRVTAINLYNRASTGRLSNGASTFICTSNHKWVTERGLVAASDILKVDTLVL